jgi:MFS transporter, DHA2 family, multidrug resistance protein
MGYTASEAGKATAWTGVFAVLVAPLAAGLSAKVDPRRLVFGGVLWLGLITLWRSVADTGMDYWQIALPLMVMGLGLPFFFVPLTGLALASVDEPEMASAAGLMNFLRTVSGAFATSLVNTAWEDRSTLNHAELVGLSDTDGKLRSVMEASGLGSDGALQSLDQLINAQSVMLSTNQLMLATGVAFIIAAFAIWLAPRPTRQVDPAAGGH